MKILHIARQFHPCVGGVERFTLDLCRYTQRAGHQVGVLTLNRDFASQASLPSADTVEGIAVRRLPFWGPRRYRVAPAAPCHLGNWDVVHIHCVDSFVDYLALTRFWHRKPLVLSTHGGFFHSAWGRGIKRAYFRLVTPRAIRAMSRVICDSRQDLELFGPLAPETTTLIENGVDYERFSAVRKRMIPGLLVHVGRTDANKRIDRLITTLALLARERPEARLALVGPDWLGEWPRLRRVAEESGVSDRVQFVGQVEEGELRRWLAEAHFFVSASAYEGFGIAAVEAMATGTVPVLNDIPAFQHLSESGSAGLLVRFDDPPQAAAALGAALTMPVARYEEISARARAAAAKYAWEQVVNRYLAVYEEALGTRNTPPGQQQPQPSH
ncbi:MAG: glycosyltransferase family 4 protein [Chloroflexota bacterium]